MTTTPELLTIVVPYYNEKHRFETFLGDFVKDWPDSKVLQEIIVVDDGSSSEDREFLNQKASQFKSSCPLRVLRLEKNSGKGAALRMGFRAATSHYIGFLDADGATNVLSAYEVFAALKASPSLSATIGSRVLMLGKHIERKSLRHYIGRVFATYVSILFSEKIYDSQCGCKFFRLRAIQPLLEIPRDQRWTWDTQILILLLKTKHRVIEVPVNWSDHAGSKVSLLHDPLRMIYYLFAFYRKHPWRS